MNTICLNMIVKNEATIIAETLANILAHIRLDYWVIADTGSTDNTRDIIVDFFKQHGIPGELHQHPWQNFGHNRQLALEAAQGKSDYVFFFDADDRFEGEFTLPEPMTSTFYNLYLTNKDRGVRYPRRLLAKNDGSIFWQGVLHEIIMAYEGKEGSESYIEGPYHVISGRFGARNQDPDKYLKDAQMLAEAFEVETNLMLKRRYAYYCGQSYRDCNRPDLAVIWYERNIELMGSITGEELRFSYIALGTEYRRLNNHAKTMEAWWMAYNAMPHHAEALGLLAQLYNNLQCYQLAFDAAQKAVTLPYPNPKQTLFLNDPIHRYVIWYELARNGLKVNQHAEAYRAVRHLLNEAEYSAELNDFLLSVLWSLRSHIEQDTIINAQTMYQRLLQLSMLSENAQPIKMQLLTHFQQLFPTPIHTLPQTHMGM